MQHVHLYTYTIDVAKPIKNTSTKHFIYKTVIIQL